MILSIDHASSEPIYHQIRSQVVAAIARGDLRPGDRLPAVRALASDLGVNLHTVNKAYALLRDEGHLTMCGRSGAHVASPSQSLTPALYEAGDERLAEAMRRLALEHRARGGTIEAFIQMAEREAAGAFGDGTSRAE